MTHLQLQLSNGRRVNVDTNRLADVHVAAHEASNEQEEAAILEDFARDLLTSDGDGAATVAGAAESDVGGVLKFIRPVSREVFEQRMALCALCEHASVIMKRSSGARHDVLRCKECGCVMNVKARLSFAACPLGKFAKG